MVARVLAMGFKKVSELAEEFAIKVAEHHYSEREPKSIRAKDLTFLDKEERDYVARMGKNWDSPLNPPPWVADKKTWERAKKAVKPYWKKQEEPFGTTAFIYRQMGGKIKKKKKSK
jgi:hypothetical protein